MNQFRFAFVGLTLASLCLLAGRLPAQQQLFQKEQIDEFLKKKFSPFITSVLAGLEPMTDQQLELASRYYVLRVTDVLALDDRKRMDLYVLEFEQMVQVAEKYAAKNRDVVGKFAPHLVNRFKEVFALDFKTNRIAIVNGAVLLPLAARLRQEAIGDYLAGIAADEKMNDAVRVHAIKAMREFFPANPFTKTELGVKANVVKKDRDVQRVDALLKYIDRPMPKARDSYEVEGIRYVRQQAVAALGKTSVPAVTSLEGKIEGNVALGLIKVLSKKVQPEPSMQERVEAAIGVCHFTKFVEEYDPQVGIFLVANCLSDMFSEYKRDFANISLKPKDRKPTYLPWKHDSRRFELALAELVANTRGTPSAVAAQNLETMAKPMLKLIFNYEPLERDQEFRTAVKRMQPNTKVLFKNPKGKPLEFEWKAAAPAEEK